MSVEKAAPLHKGPPPAVMEQLRRRLSDHEVQGLEMLLALRTTARQVDNAFSEWMADTVGSVARYQILMALLASKGNGISHTAIGAAMGVTRPTVSGLMAGLERDGFVKSYVDRDDRRKLIARLTSKGEAAIKKAFEANLVRLHSVFASFSTAELTGLMELLHHLRKSLPSAG